MLIVALNLLGIKLFGEIEVRPPLPEPVPLVPPRLTRALLSTLQFWASFLKIVVLAGLIILGLIIDLGGVPGVGRIGFRCVHSPSQSNLGSRRGRAEPSRAQSSAASS